MDDVAEVDIGNNQLVGINGDTIAVMMPRAQMTKDQALVHAAWLVALADPIGDRFEAIKQRVLNT